MAERKSVLIRIDPALHEAIQRWAAAEFRSLNAQIEVALRRALADAGRAVHDGEAGAPPPKSEEP